MRFVCGRYGADAVLLIAAVLPNKDLDLMVKVSQKLGLQCLIEVRLLLVAVLSLCCCPCGQAGAGQQKLLKRACWTHNILVTCSQIAVLQVHTIGELKRVLKLELDAARVLLGINDTNIERMYIMHCST